MSTSQTKLTLDDLILAISTDELKTSQGLEKNYEKLIDLLCFPPDHLGRRFFIEKVDGEDGYLKFIKLMKGDTYIILVIRAHDGYVVGFILKDSKENSDLAHIAYLFKPKNFNISENVDLKDSKGEENVGESRPAKLRRRLGELGFCSQADLSFGDSYNQMEDVAEFDRKDMIHGVEEFMKSFEALLGFNQLKDEKPVAKALIFFAQFFMESVRVKIQKVFILEHFPTGTKLKEIHLWAHFGWQVASRYQRNLDAGVHKNVLDHFILSWEGGDNIIEESLEIYGALLRGGTTGQKKLNMKDAYTRSRKRSRTE